MSMDKVNIFNSPIEFSDKKFKKQIFRFGKWFHEGGNKGMYEMTKEKAAKLVENFRNKVLENIPIIKGHANPAELDRHPELIAGYVSDVEVDENGINAVLEVDENDAELLGKKYKNVSIAVRENYKDHESGNLMGDVLEHVALVIEPYIKKLNPEFVAFTDTYLKDHEINNLFFSDINMKKKTVNIEEPEDIKVEELETEGTETEGTVETKVEEPVKVEESVEEAQVEAQPEETIETRMATQAIEDKKERESEGEKVEEVEEKKVEKEAEVKKEEPTVEMSELEQLRKRSKELEKQVEIERTSKIEKEVSILMSEGKITPAQKEVVSSLLNNTASVWFSESEKPVSDLFREFLEKQPKVIDFTEKGVKAVAGDSGLTADEEAQMKQFNVGKEGIQAYIEKYKS